MDALILEQPKVGGSNSGKADSIFKSYFGNDTKI